MEEKKNRQKKRSLPGRLWSFLHSMKLAVVILIVLAVVCTFGSLVTQGQPESYYLNTYQEWLAKLILRLGFDRVFTCWWFVALAAFLCVNLLLCSISRFPQVLRRFQKEYNPENRAARRDADDTVAVSGALPEELWSRMGFKKKQTVSVDGREYTYAVRNRAGVWGAWLCHLGMLVIIIGFGLGQMLSLETSVYGVPGMTKEIPGTGCTLRIDDFDIALRDDETVEQYTAALSVTDAAQVNAPMDAFGMRLYQNSTGWACNVKIYKDDELQKEQILCAGETISPDDMPELVLVFTRFYPDYYYDRTVGPMTLSSALKNPYAIFALYYEGEVIAMDSIGVGYNIDVDAYRFVFEDPQQYTLIQILKDPTMHFVAFGGLLTLLALVLAFYVRTEELWMYADAGGRQILCMRSRKGAELMKDRLRTTLGKLGVKVDELAGDDDGHEAEEPVLDVSGHGAEEPVSDDAGHVAEEPAADALGHAAEEPTLDVSGHAAEEPTSDVSGHAADTSPHADGWSTDPMGQDSAEQ